MKPQQLFPLCRDAVVAWVDDFAPSMGAAISYYTMFSLAPLLVIVIAVAGLLFGQEAVEGQIAAQLSGLIGQEGADAVQALVKAANEPSRGLLAGGISILVLIVGATTVFAELQSALDRIWHVPEKQKPSGVWGILRARLLSFGLILGLAFLLMVSLVVSAGVAAFGSWTSGLMPGWEALLQGVNTVVSIGITTVLFAMIFKLMPTVPIRWHDVWIGAVVTAVLFEVGKFAIGLYLGKSGVTESFAAAGSLVVLLAWVYYAAQIFLLGAEFTKVYANAHGSVSGEKAQAATEAAKAVADAGTDHPAAALSAGVAGAAAATGVAGTRTRSVAGGAATGAAALSAPARDVPDYEALARTAEAQREIDRRVKAATSKLAMQATVLGVTTFVSLVLTQLERRQRKDARRRRGKLMAR